MVCPLYPMHYLFSCCLLFMLLWRVAGSTISGSRLLNPRFFLDQKLLQWLPTSAGKSQNITFYLDDIPDDVIGELVLQLSSEDGAQHAETEPSRFVVNGDTATDTRPWDLPLGSEDNTTIPSSGRHMSGQFLLTGKSLGFSSLRLVLSDGNDRELMESKAMPVQVNRGRRPLDLVFIHGIIILVCFLYINMGAAIDLDVVRTILRKPVAPLIGFASQYLFMPLASYALGYLFLRPFPWMRLGLFVTGCAPGGGCSNMWTYILGGSLDLSVTMTFLSSLASAVMMPLWVGVLAPSIFRDGIFVNRPFKTGVFSFVGVAVPLFIGLLVQRCCPSFAKKLVKLLKPFCFVFLAFVIIFGTYVYWDIFQFLSWQVAVVGASLPLAGFLFGFIVAKVCRRDPKDVCAISIETGLQNTGLAIVATKVILMNFTPLADMAMVVPITVATFTPLPLLVAYLYLLWRNRGDKKGSDAGSTKELTVNDGMGYYTVA